VAYFSGHPVALFITYTVTTEHAIGWRSVTVYREVYSLQYTRRGTVLRE